MKKGLFVIIISLFIYVFISGCEELSSINLFKEKQKEKGKETAQVMVSVPEGTILAKVGKSYITLEEFNNEIEAFNNVVSDDKPDAKIDTPEEKQDYLTQMVNRRLLYTEALNKGLDKDIEFQKSVENFKISFLVAKLVDDIVGSIDVSSSEIEDYYNQIKDFLKEPQSRKVREIVVKTESEAREALIELLKDTDFAALARERSIAKSAKNGGDLGYIRPGTKGEDFTLFDEIVFSPYLEVGKLSNIFKGPDGYYIVKLEGIKEGHQPTLSEVWDKIKTTLQQQKQQEQLKSLIEKLSKETKVEIYKENIE